MTVRQLLHRHDRQHGTGPVHWPPVSAAAVAASGASLSAIGGRDGSTTENNTGLDARVGSARARPLARGSRRELECVDCPPTGGRAYRKVGFCFFDQTLFDEQRTVGCSIPIDSGADCGARAHSRSTWGSPPVGAVPTTGRCRTSDWSTTGLPDGLYRLRATADPDRAFQETNKRNNTTWVDLRLRTSNFPPRAVVLRTGPHATPSR